MSSTSQVGTAHISFAVTRSLAGFDNREREYMRIIELLNSAADGREPWYQRMRISLIMGDGKAIRSEWKAVSSTRYHGQPPQRPGNEACGADPRTARAAEELEERRKELEGTRAR